MSPIKNLIRKLKYGEPIVVVSGLPRSGTSMAMKMLEAGGYNTIQDGVRTADVDNPKGYYEDERVKHLHEMDDKSWVKEARGRVIKVISFLLKDLPDENEYRVIFMRRHLDEVLASQNKMLDHRGADNETEDARMKELYTAHIGQVESMMRMRENFSWIDIGFRDMIDKPREQAEKINAFLGGKMSVEDMVAVPDKKLYRNKAEAK
ncbi:MAG: sulfotransferase family protein [Gemmatimonadetes bacterium]|nr:sulfotransferase family protein [Gemmatimonadota bacterium]